MTRGRETRTESWRRHLGRFARPVDHRILALYLTIAAVLALFARIASEVHEGETLGFDQWLLLALRDPSNPATPIGPPWFAKAMLDLTALGGVSVLTVVTILSAGYLLAARKRATALFLIAAIVGGALMSTLLKDVFERPRPDVVAHLVTVNSTSFPSGHAMNSAIVYLTLGALLARAEQVRRVRIFILAAAIALTLTVGFSRVFLGVHWPSDVVAGWAVGGAWSMLASVLAQHLQSRKRIEPAGDA